MRTPQMPQLRFLVSFFFVLIASTLGNMKNYSNHDSFYLLPRLLLLQLELNLEHLNSQVYIDQPGLRELVTLSFP
jgi:hypothetical protein